MTVDFLIYLGKVSLSIFLLMLLFKAILSADQTLVRNRFYLMGAIIWSIFAPLLTMQQANQGNLIPAITITPTYTINLPEIVINPDNHPAQGSGIAISTIILTIYLTGVTIFLIKMVGSYIRVVYIIATAKNIAINSYHIKVTRAAITPFAFFGWIVFPKRLLEHKDLTKMLIHERVHSRQLHSLDLLLSELFTVFQWFNPASWMLKRLIIENHEFTADRAVIDLGIDTYEYQASLVNATIGREVVPVNHFSLILIKKRISMMNKKSNLVWLRIKSMLVPVAFFSALALTSFTIEMGVSKIAQADNSIISPSSAAPMAQNTSQKEDDVFLIAEVMPTFNGKDAALGFREYIGKNLIYPVSAIKKKIEGVVLTRFIIEKDGSVSSVKVTKGVSPELDNESIRVISKSKGWTPAYENGQPVRLQFDFPIKFQLDREKKNLNEKPVVVDEMPKYDGKEVSIGFQEFIARNLRYPDEAMMQGVEGTVFVSFTVKKNGSISDIKILKDANPLLEQEALRAVKAAKDWTPGKLNGEPVDVPFTFPINFRLDKHQSTTEKNFSKYLTIVNGQVFNGGSEYFTPAEIFNFSVLKGESAVKKYGKNAESGVVVITLMDGIKIPANPLNSVTITGYMKK